ncbi:MAG: ANTAR domain-containing protein [Anaerolineae bacterium]
MVELGTGETDAFQRIHRQARDSRRSMRSVVAACINITG